MNKKHTKVINITKYYMIHYMWKRINEFPSRWEHTNKFIARDPINWFMELRRDYSEEKQGLRITKYEYILKWFTEISEEQYKLYKDEMD